MPSPFSRFRGFNLLEMFSPRRFTDFAGDDFRVIRDWGFNFVRLPICYYHWADPADPFAMREPALETIDRAVRLGQTYGIHVNINMHRAPGYCSNDHSTDPKNLWKDPGLLDQFCHYWETLARRYRGTPSTALSFNLVNEPPPVEEGMMTRAEHEKVVRTATARIRAVDPQRPVIADGIAYGNQACPELADLGIMQSCRIYQPLEISHHRAQWIPGITEWPQPQWPGIKSRTGETWDRGRLDAHFAPWIALADQGVGVVCGEGGAFNRTPHDVFLAWYRDNLEILSSRGIGNVLWNLRGAFGVLDSGRTDVAYEEWRGHRLDRRLLDLLQEF